MFQERLRTVREQLRKWSRAELAERAKLPPSSIAHFETGSRKPSFETLRRLANALDVTTDYLLGRVDSPERAEAGDPLYRDIGKLTGSDREIAKDFLAMLAERSEKKREAEAMNLAFRLRIAKQKAEALLQDEGHTSLPIDPFAIARSRDIDVEPKPDVAGGVSGMLLRHGNQFGILYATHVRSEGFQRFSVAHELGHYFLEGHPDHVLKNGIHVSHAGFIADDPYEQEADQFAVGLLMPGNLFKKELGRHQAGLETIEAMHILCKTSLTATASRYAELTEDAAAIIISTGQVIDYCIMSETLKALPKLAWIKRGTPVPAGTATARFNSNPQRVANSDKEEDEIDIRDWLGGTRSVPATEQVIGLGSYGKTLTVLTCPSVQDETFADDDGDDDDESLAERWTPRFRR